jgi:hypothetical protein
MAGGDGCPFGLGGKGSAARLVATKLSLDVVDSWARGAHLEACHIVDGIYFAAK